MLRIFVVFLITQLPHSEALPCQPGEYEINTECCPMCSAGSRVFKHCTQNSSTTCMPCVGDTYTEHPNGLTECMRCKVCDPRARLIIKEKCTYTKNTICGCDPGDFCLHMEGLDCEMCRPFAICLPGSKVKRNGTEFSDNVCEVCPDGTFSATSMSHTCQPWTKCEEEELKAGTATSDAVCVQRGLSPTAIAVIIVLLLSLASAVVGAVYFSWRREKRKYGVTPGDWESRLLDNILSSANDHSCTGDRGMQPEAYFPNSLNIRETDKDESKGQDQRTLMQPRENGTDNIPTQEQRKPRAVGEERNPSSALPV